MAKYIYPPRANTSLPRGDHRLQADLGWIGQLKYNDSRTLIYIEPTPNPDQHHITLWNRHAERLKYNPPIPLQEQLEELAKTLMVKDTTILDGGLLHNKHKAIKNILVIWDILMLNGKHLIGSTYSHRYNHLTTSLSQADWIYTQNGEHYDLGTSYSENIKMPKNIGPSDWDTAWDLIDSINKPHDQPLIEGIVFKDPDGVLKQGFGPKNNTHWQVRSRVTTARHVF